jgi:hypothetical protein
MNNITILTSKIQGEDKGRPGTAPPRKSHILNDLCRKGRKKPQSEKVFENL